MAVALGALSAADEHDRGVDVAGRERDVDAGGHFVLRVLRFEVAADGLDGGGGLPTEFAVALDIIVGEGLPKPAPVDALEARYVEVGGRWRGRALSDRLSQRVRVPRERLDGDGVGELLVGEAVRLDVVCDHPEIAVVAGGPDPEVGVGVDDVVAAGEPREPVRLGEPDRFEPALVEIRVEPLGAGGEIDHTR